MGCGFVALVGRINVISMALARKEVQIVAKVCLTIGISSV
jgi:hypothetical protein